MFAKTRYVGLVALLCMLMISVFPAPAEACSCAGPFDLKQSINDSEAAFVGTLLDRRDAGKGEFGHESIYVFEVEEWVKGDLGDVIEVRSASGGAGCGFEFFDDDRIGAFLRLDNGELTGGLCSQVDADALLAAGKEPVMSRTGIGRLLVAHGWSSPMMTVLDTEGATVIELGPSNEPEPFTGTTDLVLCPGGEHALQLTSSQIDVWDLESFTVVATHDVISEDGTMWVRTVSCRTPDASSILAVAQSDSRSALYELVPVWQEILDLPGDTWQIGSSFVIAQMGHENDPVLVDISTGERITLHETPPGALQAIAVAPHPTDARLAMLETRFAEEGPVEATLFILDGQGTLLESFEVPWEAYSPTWLDDNRLMVQAYDFEDRQKTFGYVFDVSTGETKIIDGWDGSHVIADGSSVYGISGGDVITADLDLGSWERLVTLPTQTAGPVVLLENEPVVPAPDTTIATNTTVGPDRPVSTTVPPLVAPDFGVASKSSVAVQWLAGAALVGFVVGLFWLARRST